MKCISRNFDIGDLGQFNFATSPLYANGKNIVFTLNIKKYIKMKGVSLGRKAFETLSNVGLQVDLTP